MDQWCHLNPETVQHRVVYAVQFVRQVDQHGYIRFRHWRVYGERGLAGSAVSGWVYDGSLRLEYESVLLARYGLVLERDGKHIRDVKNAQLAATRFRSPQLSLFDLGPNDWLLYVRLPEYASRKLVVLANVVQLPLLVDASGG